MNSFGVLTVPVSDTLAVVMNAEVGLCDAFSQATMKPEEVPTTEGKNWSVAPCEIWNGAPMAAPLGARIKP